MPKLSYPDCWLLWLPPMSNPSIRTPGACPSIDQMSVAVGMPTSFSPEKADPTFVVAMSTTGDSPVTVTLSASVATCSWISSVSVVPTLRTIPSRTSVVNPASS